LKIFLHKKSWVLGIGWVKAKFNVNFYKKYPIYEDLGMGWVDIPKPIPKTQIFFWVYSEWG